MKFLESLANRTRWYERRDSLLPLRSPLRNILSEECEENKKGV